MPNAKTSDRAIDVLAAELLRRHVGERADQFAGTRAVATSMVIASAATAADALRDAEVHHLDVPVGADHHVGGLQIPMDDPPRVREVQRVGDFGRDAKRHLQSAARPAASCSFSVYAVRRTPSR